MSSPQIYRLKTIEQMKETEDLQCQIWGYGEDGQDAVYPARALFALSESGGLVSGARIEGTLVGFSLAWIGREESSQDIFLQSQLLGVLPTYRGLNIGYQLKLVQREYAISQSINQIRWTFDPLQAANARLNLHKLGVVCYRFRPDYYGNLRSHLVHGSSDRLLAEWFVSSPRVRQLVNKRERVIIHPEVYRAIVCETATINNDLIRIPKEVVFEAEPAEVLIEIPSSLAQITSQDSSLLAAWSSAVREALDYYLSQNYVIQDLWNHGFGSQQLSFYHLTRRKLSDILQSTSE